MCPCRKSWRQDQLCGMYEAGRTVGSLVAMRTSAKIGPKIAQNAFWITYFSLCLYPIFSKFFGGSLRNASANLSNPNQFNKMDFWLAQHSENANDSCIYLGAVFFPNVFYERPENNWAYGVHWTGLLRSSYTWDMLIFRRVYHFRFVVLLIILRTGAMKINAATSNSTQKDLEVELRKWFTNSRDRGDGSRKKKTARSILPATVEN